MSNHTYCHGCGLCYETSDFTPVKEWNQDIPGYEHFVICPCGEEENDLEAYSCDGCGDYFPEHHFAPGADLCWKCHEVEEAA